MRIVCFIMVGAFLLSIAIADNGNSMRVRPQSRFTRQPSFSSNVKRVIRNRPYSQAASVPRLVVRVPRHGSVLSPRNDIFLEDNIASPADAAVQHSQPETARKAKAMILEPIKKPQRSSWSDWMPDFFGDQSDGPAPLIGPIEFPGLGNQVFIRQTELDDDINHVVVHLINREPHGAGYSSQSTSSQHQTQQQTHHPYYANQHSDGKPSSAKPPPNEAISDYEREDFSKLVNENPWQLINSENSIKEKNSHDSHDAGFVPMPNPSIEAQSKYSVMVLKQSGSEPPRVVWSRFLDRQGRNYRRSLDPDPKDSVPFSSSAQQQSSRNDTVAKTDDSTEKSGSQYSSLRRQGYPNGTEAASESFRPAVSLLRQRNLAKDEIPRFKPSLNYLDEITVASKTERQPPRRHQVNAYRISFPGAFPDGTSRQPRNRYSAVKHFDRGADLQKIGAGALQEVAAPDLQNDNEDVMQNIMSMTASQSWRNVTRSSSKKGLDEEEKEEKEATTPTSVQLERRSDSVPFDGEQTKERRKSRANNAATANKTDKPEAKMKEAVEKMMSSFSQWRHKVVTTAFAKQLDEKKKNKSKAVSDDSRSR